MKVIAESVLRWAVVELMCPTKFHSLPQAVLPGLSTEYGGNGMYLPSWYVVGANVSQPANFLGI